MPPDLETQRTIDRAISIEGVAVHSGSRVRLELEPAEPNSGIVFRRIDLEGAPEIPVGLESLPDRAPRRMTVLEQGGGGKSPASVGMTEHLLASCLGLGISNLRIAVSGPECPILDGSALPYVEALKQAGIREQTGPLRTFRLRRPVCFKNGQVDIVAIPAEKPRFTFFAEFAHAGIPDQQATFDLCRGDFAVEIAPARTFCFYEEVKELLASGLGQGGSNDSVIVLRDGGPMTGDYRLQNELARHKLLDLMGDVAILGAPVRALISARRSGHATHQEFVRLLRKELIDG